MNLYMVTHMIAETTHVAATLLLRMLAQGLKTACTSGGSAPLAPKHPRADAVYQSNKATTATQ